MFFLTAFLEKAFIINNYTTIIIMYKKLIIITEGSKTLFCSPKFPLEHGRTSPKCKDSLDTRSQKGLQALK
jgi:hypothetical protein